MWNLPKSSTNVAKIMELAKLLDKGMCGHSEEFFTYSL